MNRKDISQWTVAEVVEYLLKGNEAISRLAGSAVQFRIKDVDADREAVYERTKGKGF